MRGRSARTGAGTSEVVPLSELLSPETGSETLLEVLEELPPDVSGLLHAVRLSARINVKAMD